MLIMHAPDVPLPERLPSRLILLRCAKPADAQRLYLAARNAEVMRFMDWAMPTDPRDTESHLRASATDWDAASEYRWVIVERSGTESVGIISCRLMFQRPAPVTPQKRAAAAAPADNCDRRAPH